MAPTGDEGPYHPVDAIVAGTRGVTIAGAVGVFAAALENASRRENVGAMGVFTRSGRTIFTFAAVGAVYEFARTASANLRQKNDHYNCGIGGFLAGSILGMRGGRIPAVLGYGAFTSIVLAAYEYTGSSLAGKKPEVEGMDEFERKQALRTARRRPVEETVELLGEGRGVQGPGFEARRRKRLEEKYGVEIKPVSAEAS